MLVYQISHNAECCYAGYRYAECNGSLCNALVMYVGCKILHLYLRTMGKLTGDNLKVVWAEFFALGLAVYPYVRKVHGVNTHSCLDLKTRPRFGPASLSLSVV